MKKHFIGLTTLCLVLAMGISSVSAKTPPGLEKKGGLPPGIQKRFIMQEKEDKEYNTVIKDINIAEKRVIIEDGTAILHLLVGNKSKIELNKKTVRLEDIRKGDEVSIKLDKDNTIKELKATRKNETTYTVEGKLLLINKGQKEIYLYENNKLVTYGLKSDVVVQINGVKKNLDDLVMGMDLKLTLDGKNVKLIETTKEVQTKVQGTIIGIDHTRLELVLQEGTKVTLYKAKSSTPITIDGKTKVFANLLIGMEIQANVIDQNIVSIQGKSLAIENVKGIVKSVNVDRKEIVLVQDKKETLYKVSSNATIKINGVVKALKDIAINIEAQLTVQNGEVIEININEAIQTYTGRIITKDMGTAPSIIIQIGNEYKLFKVKKDLSIVEIEVGKDAVIYVKDNEVIAFNMK